MMSRKERRSVSLGRHRDRSAHGNGHSNRESQCLEEELSTRHNISNYLLTLQRVQAAEEENRLLRKENQVLRQRVRGSRLSTSSSLRDSPCQHNTSSSDDASLYPAMEEEVAEAETKRNSLIFVGDSSPIAPPSSPESASLESQHRRLQSDFAALKQFLQQLLQHANSKDEVWQHKNNGYSQQSKQLEKNLEEIQDHICLSKSNQNGHKIDVTQVQSVLGSLLHQPSYDVTTRLARQQDKVKELNGHVVHLEARLMEAVTSLRAAEERLSQSGEVARSLSQHINSSRQVKGGAREELNKFASRLTSLSQTCTSCGGKTSPLTSVSRFMSYVSGATHRRGTDGQCDLRFSAEVVEVMTRLERLVGSDWHRLGRLLGLTSDQLEEVGKFTNFDLTSRVEKVIVCWMKVMRGSGVEGLRSALEKMDRDMGLLAEPPVTKDWFQPPSEVMTFATAHMINVLDLTDVLAGQGVIGQSSKLFIAAVSQEHRRANRLLQTVVYMGLHALGVLCTALEEHSQSIVASKIKGCLPARTTSDDFPAKSHNYQTLTSPRKSSPITVYNGSSTLTHPSHNTTCNSTLTYSTPKNNNNKTPASSSSAPPPKSTNTSSKSGTEKQRKKRSRSLFTRKNKQRDVTEVDLDTRDLDLDGGFQVPGDYYYPAVNMNYHSRYLEDGRNDDTLTYGRQHIRHATHDLVHTKHTSQTTHLPTKYPISNCIDGVVV